MGSALNFVLKSSDFFSALAPLCRRYKVWAGCSAASLGTACRCHANCPGHDAAVQVWKTYLHPSAWRTGQDRNIQAAPWDHCSQFSWGGPDGTGPTLWGVSSPVAWARCYMLLLLFSTWELWTWQFGLASTYITGPSQILANRMNSGVIKL